MGWLKLNAGMFMSETAGHSDTHVAIYVKLMIIYWTSGNKLPSIDRALHRRLGISDAQGEIALADLLNEFFPLDEEDHYCHTELDRQLNGIKAFSIEQSERAKKPRGNLKIAEAAFDDDDKF